MKSDIRALSISTLSPVHIGCDDVYEPSNFVIHGGLLHALDAADLVESLTAEERNELVRRSEQRDPIGALQQFFRNRAERFAGLARHQVAVAEGIVREYEQKAGKAVQNGPAGTPVYNVFPIARTAYRPVDSAPYLPGSSLKGSIRTAWLNHENHGKPLTPADKAGGRNASRQLQERLLGYTAGKFENDPFRHLALADAQPEAEDAPPTRVLYAVSKKKRPPRDGERPPQELKTYLETIPEAMPASFQGELRLSEKARFGWKELCNACNGFYRPQLEAELEHAVLGSLLDPAWKKLVGGLLADEIAELIAARQGFLLRVGHHSGAESVTLDGVRSIKILGPRVAGKQTFELRPNTTEKRLASLTRAGADNLLPFGWIWVDACDDEHRHLADSLRRKLAARSAPLREAHRERLLRLDEQQQSRQAEMAAAEAARKLAEAEEKAKVEAEAARQATLPAMTPNVRRVEEFKAAFAARAEQLRGGREKLNGDYHGRARQLARDALERADWTAEEKRAASDAIAEWLPKVVEKIDKDQLKKLKLGALRGLQP